MSPTLPDKTVMCHRTNFEKSCFSCVVEHGCRLWKHVTLEHDPTTGKPAVDHYDCADSLIDLYMKDMLRRQVQTTGSIDNLRKEVRDANDGGMASALAGINAQLIGRMGDHRMNTIAAEPQMLLELEG